MKTSLIASKRNHHHHNNHENATETPKPHRGGGAYLAKTSPQSEFREFIQYDNLTRKF